MPIQQILESDLTGRRIVDLHDNPDKTAADLKEAFDYVPNHIVENFNALVTALTTMEGSLSAAEQISSKGILGVGNGQDTTIQEQLIALRDFATGIGADAQAGTLTPGVVDDTKLSNADGNIKDRFAQHILSNADHILLGEVETTSTASAYVFTKDGRSWNDFKDRHCLFTIAPRMACAANATIDICGSGPKEIYTAYSDHVDAAQMLAFTFYHFLWSPETTGFGRLYLMNPNYPAAFLLEKIKVVDGTGSLLDSDTLDGIHASGFVTTSQYTANDVLAKIKTVDGSGKGLDADTVDGIHASGFITTSQYTADDVLTKLKTVGGSGKGLDADMLDGIHASGFVTTAQYNANDVLTKLKMVDGTPSGLDAATVGGKDVQAILKLVYPKDSIYISISPTNPFDVFGFGTWVSFGAGRTLVGFDSTQAEFDTVGGTGGEKTHKLTPNEMPRHTHEFPHTGDVAGSYYGYPVTTANGANVTGANSLNMSFNGADVAHNNLQPYITVYMWKRTA